MPNHKTSVLLALSLISSPIALPSTAPSCANHTKTISSITSTEAISRRAPTRRMKHLLATLPRLAEPILESQANYIQPALANHIDAPLPLETSSDEIVGIYGNILYPEDRELAQKQKLIDWMEAYSENSNISFPLSPEELNDISIYRLERFPFSQIISRYFATRVQHHLTEGLSLEIGLENAAQETFIWSQEIIKKIPALNGRSEILIGRLSECANQAELTIERAAKAIRENPEEAFKSLLEKRSELIEPPFTWDVRADVFKQMIDKIISASPNSQDPG